MDLHHHRSGDSFSFPSTPNPDSLTDDEFEFGSLTPDSPNSSDPSRGSPADHLFFKGRLLPHSFPPLQPHPTLLLYDTSRPTTTTPSNDSLVLTSSRSNSTNSSRSSSCNSARTSSSDSSERRLFYNRISSSGRGAYQHHHATKMAYGCSQRWQYITPVPAAALSRDTSRRRKEEAAAAAKAKTTTSREDRRSRVGLRIFRWVVMACKECHALEPSRKEKILRKDVKL